MLQRDNSQVVPSDNECSHNELHRMLMRISHVTNEVPPKYLGRIILYLHGVFLIMEEIAVAPSSPQGEEPETNVLTRAQLATLTLWAEGMCTKTIAERLHITQDTVKTHTKMACRRLGVRGGRLVAIAEARKLGLIP